MDDQINQDGNSDITKAVWLSCVRDAHASAFCVIVETNSKSFVNGITFREIQNKALKLSKRNLAFGELTYTFYKMVYRLTTNYHYP